MIKNVFIISYNGINELAKWFNNNKFSSDTKVHIIDNGNQVIPDILKPNIFHICKENIFCSGGWNLALKSAFKLLNVDKTIVTEDDVVFHQEVIDKTFELSKPNNIVGANEGLFFYSFYCMHKNTFDKVGEFDENCLYVTCEDADYIHRCNLTNVKHLSAGYRLEDKHLASSILSYKFGNLEYIQEKWRPDSIKNTSPFSYHWSKTTSYHPFNTPGYNKIRDEYWDHFKTNEGDFMSEIEFHRVII